MQEDRRQEDPRDPDDDAHINTSYVERHNLTMRMHMRRLTRPTNAFSKQLVYLAHAVALDTVEYNFVRRHQTLGAAPAWVLDRIGIRIGGVLSDVYGLNGHVIADESSGTAGAGRPAAPLGRARRLATRPAHGWPSCGEDLRVPAC